MKTRNKEEKGITLGAKWGYPLSKTRVSPLAPSEKGITLVALIVTVVIMAILAAVTITAVTNMSIVSLSQRAAENYIAV